MLKCKQYGCIFGISNNVVFGHVHVKFDFDSEFVFTFHRWYVNIIVLVICVLSNLHKHIDRLMLFIGNKDDYFTSYYKLQSVHSMQKYMGPVNDNNRWNFYQFYDDYGENGYNKEMVHD